MFSKYKMFLLNMSKKYVTVVVLTICNAFKISLIITPMYISAHKSTAQLHPIIEL